MKSIDTSGEDHGKSSEKWELEAGTGIEPVFTDLQSSRFPLENNTIEPEEYRDKSRSFGEPDTRRSSLSRHASPAHKRAVRVLGYALTVDDRAGWNTASAIWAARLTMGERAALAMAALASLEPEEAEVVVREVLGGAGMPIPPCLDPLEEAQFWADLATPAELRAYCLAAFMALPRKAQRDFLAFAQEAGE